MIIIHQHNQAHNAKEMPKQGVDFVGSIGNNLLDLAINEIMKDITLKQNLQNSLLNKTYILKYPNNG